jgi:hypothetical protein
MNVLSLANTGDKAATYSISFVQRRMNEDGVLQALMRFTQHQPCTSSFLRNLSSVRKDFLNSQLYHHSASKPNCNTKTCFI